MAEPTDVRDLIATPTPKDEWEWFGHAGHFICGHMCRFHLCTRVGGYLISTVGELWFDKRSREIHAEIHDPKWFKKNCHRKGDDFDAAYMKRFGFETVGYDRLYETMVFRVGKPCTTKDCGCGLPSIDGHELDFAGYNRADEATRGHYAMCERWSDNPNPEAPDAE